MSAAGTGITEGPRQALLRPPGHRQKARTWVLELQRQTTRDRPPLAEVSPELEAGRQPFLPPPHYSWLGEVSGKCGL